VRLGQSDHKVTHRWRELQCIPVPGVLSVSVYRFKIICAASVPWSGRRLLLRSDHNVADLHYAIQISMGWSDSHLHFHIHGREARRLAGRKSSTTRCWLSEFRFETTGILVAVNVSRRRMISGWSQLIWARSHAMWAEAPPLVAVNLSRNRCCSQAERFMISSRYTYRVKSGS
jgi:hypothetical protein